jgi:hypothetical protein
MLDIITLHNIDEKSYSVSFLHRDRYFSLLSMGSGRKR